MKIKFTSRKARIRLFSEDESLIITSITHHTLHYHYVLYTIYIYDTYVHFSIDEEICE